MCLYHETVECHILSLTHCFSDLSFLILRMSMVNPRADPPIIKMMMSERTPPTTEADIAGKNQPKHSLQWSVYLISLQSVVYSRQHFATLKQS